MFTRLTVFTRNEKQAECLSILFPKVLMMHLMGPADRSDIRIDRPREPLESLVDDHIMDQEIGGAICHDPKAGRLQYIMLPERSGQDKQETGDGEYQEKGVVLFKKTLFRPVMIRMQNPKESMHDEFVRAPRNPLHTAKGQKQHSQVTDDMHGYSF
jgi:hypothetical protein